MENLLKKAILFEEKVSLFDKNIREDAKYLYMIAGKLLNKSQKEDNIMRSKRLEHAAKLVLQASDILKDL